MRKKRVNKFSETGDWRDKCALKLHLLQMRFLLSHALSLSLLASRVYTASRQFIISVQFNVTSFSVVVVAVFGFATAISIVKPILCNASSLLPAFFSFHFAHKT